jgi:hypothetical protein
MFWTLMIDVAFLSLADPVASRGGSWSVSLRGLFVSPSIQAPKLTD